MRLLAMLIVLVVSATSLAQTVEKVKGTEVVVSIRGGEALLVGEKVSFLNDELNVSGQGEVTKVSDGGKQAIVKILSGGAKPGMTLEKVVSAEKKTESVSKGAPHSNYQTLSDEDRKILSNGEISTTAYVVGGIIGTYPVGFGVGHAIQGRYTDKGWIFTVGELGSLVVAYAGAGDCFSSMIAGDKCNGGLLFLGAAGFVGFRIWEIVDLWAAPPEINRRYRELKQRFGINNSLSPYLASSRDGTPILGLGLRF